MSRRTNKDYELFVKSLEHYSERLCKLKTDDELQHGSNLIKKDLQENSNKALEVAQDFEAYKSNNTTNDHLALLKSALTLYKRDLQEGSITLQKKMGVKISLKNVCDEISHIEDIFESRNWDEPTLDKDKN